MKKQIVRTEEAPSSPLYSQGVRVGSTIYVSGMVGIDAATGELASLSGDVGEIGGVAQKTVTVQRAGAQVFLVPRANYAEAKAHAGKGLRVIPIDNIDGALRALGELKGSNAPTYALPGPKRGA